MGNRLRAKLGKTGLVAVIAAIAGALILAMAGAIIAVVMVASEMNTAASSAAQKDWFPIVAVFWGVVGGIGGAVCGALFGSGVGLVISLAVGKRDQNQS